jgi:hypothetical protein
MTVSSPRAHGDQVGLQPSFDTGDAANFDGNADADNFDIDAAGRGEAADGEATEERKVW